MALSGPALGVADSSGCDCRCRAILLGRSGAICGSGCASGCGFEFNFITNGSRFEKRRAVRYCINARSNGTSSNGASVNRVGCAGLGGVNRLAVCDPVRDWVGIGCRAGVAIWIL